MLHFYFSIWLKMVTSSKHFINPLVNLENGFVGDFDPNVLPVDLFPDDIDLDQLVDLDFLKEVMQNAEGPSERHGTPVSDSEVRTHINNSIPANTKNRNAWSKRVFDSWKCGRQIQHGEQWGECLKKELHMMTTDEKNYWFPKFLLEIRKQDGSFYPPKTLISILAGIQGHLTEMGQPIRFFKNEVHIPIINALDASMKLSVRNGVNVYRKKANVISRSDEKLLWEKGQLGSSTPNQLMRTLFYYNGLHFGLRGGEEHTKLTIDQFSVIKKEEKEFLQYKEGSGKTYHGGLRDVRRDPNIKIYPASGDPASCHVELFKKFVKVRPSNTNRFYLQTINKAESGPEKFGTWFTSRPIGHNVLRTMLQKMCSAVGLSGYYTNHSLRATLATRLYQEEVSEQVIMEMTGHKSLEGVRSYKRTSEVQIDTAAVSIDIKRCKEICERTGLPMEDGRNHQPSFIFNNCNVTINNNSGPI